MLRMPFEQLISVSGLFNVLLTDILQSTRGVHLYIEYYYSYVH
jgi:hypothetical protein